MGGLIVILRLSSSKSPDTGSQFTPAPVHTNWESALPCVRVWLKLNVSFHDRNIAPTTTKCQHRMKGSTLKRLPQPATTAHMGSRTYCWGNLTT